MYKIVLSTQAEKFYRRLFATNKDIFLRIDNSLKALQTDPYRGKPLKGKLKGKYSLRVGVYRIVYSVERQEIAVYILDISHRRESYRFN